MKIEFINETVNIEGLTYRQLALIEEVVNQASRAGGYQIDIDDYEDIMKGFREINIKDVFDLEEEKKQIYESYFNTHDKESAAALFKNTFRENNV